MWPMMIFNLGNLSKTPYAIIRTHWVSTSWCQPYPDPLKM